MSSYLVAFANGNFEHIESSYVSPLSGKTRPLRIYGKSPFYNKLKCCSYTETLMNYSHCGLYPPGRVCT